jgi:hypothetical protein
MPNKSQRESVLTVVVDKNPNLGDAVTIAERQKAEGKVREWRPAIAVQGIEVILTPGTDARGVAKEYRDAGFLVIEIQYGLEESSKGGRRLGATVVKHR